MGSEVIKLEESVSEEDLVQLIEELNEKEDVHGILVQLPLPEHINDQVIVETIVPEKDVDGFHPINVGRMMHEQDTLLPCTPLGIMEMLDSKNIDVTGKHAVVVGSSNIVGKPVGQLDRKSTRLNSSHVAT